MGGDLLVRGAVALARRARVSPMVVAFSVVAFGTSVPELVVTLQASLTGYPELVLGNVVGSNIANVLLVVGASAVVYPLGSGQGSERRDAGIMMLVSFGFVLLCFLGDLTRVGGLLLLAGMVVVLVSTVRSTLHEYQSSDRTTPLEWVLGLPTQLGMIALFVVAGAVGLPVGASLMVEAAVDIAESFGVPQTVIGLTIVAIGTSLPELATVVAAAMHRRTEVVVGTVMGSNTFNLLGIMGLGAALSQRPITVSDRLLGQDLPVMLGVGMFLTAFVLARRRIGRGTGVVFLGAYLTYLTLLLLSV
jgi:cation:H+ antiporter